ncbi:UTRA domain-containing protein [Salipiger thiooxidans]|uniref:UTRA domain-containing protein n=1 Tax=Salipiger thiooxidans TaxID=282683 RepID=A0A1G7G0U2_9RHOB|nr:UTRA domain-containing protein [Salipiger thiooxidans]SDE81722.1 UTRA domain-containing protein [Salipiger thiooxidans]
MSIASPASPTATAAALRKSAVSRYLQLAGLFRRRIESGDWPGRAAQSYRRIRRRNWRDGEAFMVSDLYIDERAYAALPPDALAQMTAMRIASELPGRQVADAQQELTVIGADLTVSQELSVRLGEPMARVVRVAVDSDGLRFLVTDGIYRGDAARLRVKLK